MVYHDIRLSGDFLVSPYRAYTTELSKTFDALDANADLFARMGEILKRIVFIVVIPIAIPFTAVLLSLGMAVKSIDLACRGDELYSNRPMITSHFQFILEMVSRLGDRLLAYAHAKYLGQEHDLPLYYKPFKGEEIFNLRNKEAENGSVIYDPQAPLYFKRTVYLETDQDLEQLNHIDPNESVLYVVPFYPESKISRGDGYDGIRREIQWDDPRIKEQNQFFLRVEAESNGVVELELPDNAYTIAVHFRTGGDFDHPDMATLFPARLPLKQFYYDELSNVIRQRIAEVNGNPGIVKKDFFIHIFTDSTNAEGLKNELAAELESRGLMQLLQENGMNIQLSYRHNAPVKDDFYNMSKPFDCFLHPDSNMSSTISKYIDYPLEIYPSHYHIESDWSQIVIDEVEYATRDAEGVKQTRQESREYNMDVVTRCYLPLEFYKWWHRNTLGPNYGN